MLPDTTISTHEEDMGKRIIGRPPKVGKLVPRQFMIDPAQDEWLRTKVFHEPDKYPSKSEIVREAIDRMMKGKK